MMRRYLPCFVLLAGCGGPGPATPAPPAKTGCAERVLTELQSSAPSGWKVARVQSGQVTPMHWPEGPGIELRAHAPGTTSTDWKQGHGGNVHVWIMKAGYAGTAQPDPRSQVEAATEIGTCDGGRVLVLGIGNQDWPTWERDVSDALP